MPASTNLVNLERVDKAYGVQPVLDSVSLGIGTGERIGVVGRNGGGKTTLLRVLGRREEPDAGRVTHGRGLRVAVVGQYDDLDPGATVECAVLGDRPRDRAEADRNVRDVLAGLLTGLALDRTIGELSGGERRRVALARALVTPHDLLLLDEPTNHLDVEVTDWLARHLAGRSESLLMVSHDRWLLDAVCTRTWEVHDGRVEIYDGGYAAYVLARAERARLSGAAQTKRANLLRKELAWLHRGAKARTSKPKFRFDAAEALVRGEPPPRDTLELARFAAARLGRTVVDVEDATVRLGDRTVIDRLTWQLGPGDRVGVIGVNGSGKTTLLRALAGEIRPEAGRVVRGRTVRVGQLTQVATSVDPDLRVTEAVEEISRIVTVDGKDRSAAQLLERFGFGRERLRSRVADLSGGERRRLDLLRLFVAEPNVLLLDEPTNDLDVETLNVLEDLLDGWPGSVVVVSHDRYFLERTCDTLLALLDDGRLVLLPGGVEEYLERRRTGVDRRAVASTGTPVARGAGSGAAGVVGAAGVAAVAGATGAAAERAARKELTRLERQIGRLGAREKELHEELARHAADYERLRDLDLELRAVHGERDELETRWLGMAEEIG